MNCKECFYFGNVSTSNLIVCWDRKGKESEIGFCHKEVPSVACQVQHIYMPKYVYAGDWCGEFKEKEKEKENKVIECDHNWESATTGRLQCSKCKSLWHAKHRTKQ